MSPGTGLSTGDRILFYSPGVVPASGPGSEVPLRMGSVYGCCTSHWHTCPHSGRETWALPAGLCLPQKVQKRPTQRSLNPQRLNLFPLSCWMLVLCASLCRQNYLQGYLGQGW